MVMEIFQHEILQHEILSNDVFLFFTYATLVLTTAYFMIKYFP